MDWTKPCDNAPLKVGGEPNHGRLEAMVWPIGRSIASTLDGQDSPLGRRCVHNAGTAVVFRIAKERMQ